MESGFNEKPQTEDSSNYLGRGGGIPTSGYCEVRKNDDKTWPGSQQTLTTFWTSSQELEEGQEALLI